METNSCSARKKCKTVSSLSFPRETKEKAKQKHSRETKTKNGEEHIAEALTNYHEVHCSDGVTLPTNTGVFRAKMVPGFQESRTSFNKVEFFR